LLFYTFQITKTPGANVFSPEENHVLGAVAEDTAGTVFSQNDIGSIYINFQRILFGDIQCAAQLNRQRNPAQVIDAAYNSNRFHSSSLQFTQCAVHKQNAFLSKHLVVNSMTLFSQFVNHSTINNRNLLQITANIPSYAGTRRRWLHGDGVGMGRSGGGVGAVRLNKRKHG
jgi:hypothetical protein